MQSGPSTLPSTLFPRGSSTFMDVALEARERRKYLKEAGAFVSRNVQADIEGQELQRRGQFHKIEKRHGRAGYVLGRSRAEVQAREFLRFFVDHFLGFSRVAFGEPLGRFFVMRANPPTEPLVVILGREESIAVMTSLGLKCFANFNTPLGHEGFPVWTIFPTLFLSVEFKTQFTSLVASVVDKLMLDLEEHERKRSSADASSSTSANFPPLFPPPHKLPSTPSTNKKLFYTEIWITLFLSIFASSPPTLAGIQTASWFSAATSLLWAAAYYFYGLRWTLAGIHEATLFHCMNCFRLKNDAWFLMTPSNFRLPVIVILAWFLPPYLFLAYLPAWAEPLPSLALSLAVPDPIRVFPAGIWFLRYIPVVGKYFWALGVWVILTLQVALERGRNCGCIDGETTVQRNERVKRGGKVGEVMTEQEKRREVEKKKREERRMRRGGGVGAS